MLNTLHITRTSGTAPGDCLGGAPSYAPYNGLYPWIESDTLGCLNVLHATGCVGKIPRWTIDGDGDGNYRLTILQSFSGTAAITESPQTLSVVATNFVPCRARIEFTSGGAVVNPTFTGSTLTITYTGTLTEGQVLIIDGALQTATLDGVDVTANLSGSFPTMADGSTVTFADDVSSDHLGTMTVTNASINGGWQAVSLGTPTPLFAPIGYYDYGLYVTVVVDADAHASGTLTGRTCRQNNMPTIDVAETSNNYYRCYTLRATDSIELTYVNSTNCLYFLSAVNPGNQPVTDGLTEPTGITTWATPAAVSRTMVAGDTCYLWINTSFTVESGLTANRISVDLEVTYTHSTSENSVTLYQTWWQTDEDVTGVYLSFEDASTVPVEPPAYVQKTLPIIADITGGLPISSRAAAFYGNKYGLLSQAQYLRTELSVSALGVDLIAPPPPIETYAGGDSPTAADIGGGMVRVVAYWQPTPEWKSIESFVVYQYDRTTAERTHFEATAGPIQRDGLYKLDTTTGPMIWGREYHYTVAVKSKGKEGDAAAGNPSCTVIMASAAPGIGAYGMLSAGNHLLASHASSAVDANSVRAIYMDAGSVVVQTAAGAALWSVAASGLSNGIYFHGRSQVTAAVTGSGTSPVIVDGSDYYLCAGGNRVVKISASTFTAGTYETITTDCPSPGPIVTLGNSVYWQIFSLVKGRWITYFRVDSDGTLALGLGVLDT